MNLIAQRMCFVVSILMISTVEQAISNSLLKGQTVSVRNLRNFERYFRHHESPYLSSWHLVCSLLLRSNRSQNDMLGGNR